VKNYCLTIDVVAGAFDKRECITLVLAKNGDVFLAYGDGYILVRLDGQKLDSPSFPCQTQQTKHESACTNPLQISTTTYNRQPRSIRLRLWEKVSPLKALPQSRLVPGSASNIQSGARRPHSQFRTCRDASILEMQEVQTSFRQYMQLFGAADALQNSHFLHQLTSDRNLLNSEHSGRTDDV
jgi:hypothetical protein